MLITVDYGHGLSTSGKRPPNGGLNGQEREFKFNKLYGEAFREEILTYKNVSVVVVNDISGKVDTPLKQRTDKANSLKSQLHISFHANASSGVWGSHGGCETHVYKNVSNTSDSYKLAQKIQSAMVGASSLRDRGVKKTNLHITRETKMTSCLCEVAFMDSKTDIKVLRDTAKMQKIGKAIATAVAQFYGLKKKATTTTTTTTSKPATTTATTGAKTHTVKSGDTLWKISQTYGVTVKEIQTWNNMGTKTTLSIGQKLIVSKVKTYKVVKGDSLWAIAKKFGCTVAQLKSWNNLKTDTLSIGQVLIVKK